MSDIAKILSQLEIDRNAANDELKKIEVRIRTDLDRMKELEGRILPNFDKAIKTLQVSFGKAVTSDWKASVPELVGNGVFTAKEVAQKLEEMGYLNITVGKVANWLAVQKKSGHALQPKKMKWQLVY